MFSFSKIKKWLLGGLIVVALLISALIIYVEINKEKIAYLVAEQINQSIHGHFSFESCDVSLLRSFPYLGIYLHKSSLRDSSENTEEPLMYMEDFGIKLNLVDAIKNSSDVAIKELVFDGMKLNLLIRADSSNNFTIMKESEGSAETSTNLDLKRVIIKNSSIRYNDISSGTNTDLDEINLKGRIRYKDGFSYLSTELSSVLSLNVVNVLPNYRLNLKANTNFEMNPSGDHIKITQSSFRLNDLPLDLDGEVFIKENDIYEYKLSLNSPATEVKSLISLLPAIYKNDYGKIVSKGTYAFKGDFNGSTKDLYPTYEIAISARDGAINYPKLKKSIHKINFDLKVLNDNPKTQYTLIDLKKLDVAMGESFLKGDVWVRPNRKTNHVKTDLLMDLNFKDILESIDLSETNKLEGTTKGKLKVNTTLDENSNLLASEFIADLIVDGLVYGSETPDSDISISRARINSDNQKLDFEVTGLKYGSVADLDLKGFILNPVELISQKEALLKASIDIQSRLINMDAMTTESSSNVRYTIPNSEISYKFKSDVLKRKPYMINGLSSAGTLRSNNSDVSFDIIDLAGHKIQGSGTLENVLGYGLNNDLLSGQLVIVTQSFNADTFMEIHDQMEASASDEPLIPANIALDISYTTNSLIFKGLTLKDVTGFLQIKDQKLGFDNEGTMLGGRIGLNGIFDASILDDYKVDFNFELKDLFFSQAASQTKLFAKLVPIANLLDGKFDASLNWKSDLGKDYFPLLNTLNSFGVLETQSGRINGTLPFDQFLQGFDKLSNLSSWNLSNTKNWFIIEDGRVIVQEMNFQKSDVKVKLSGSHSLSQDLDYKVILDLPKSKLKIDELGKLLKNNNALFNRFNEFTENMEFQIELHLGGNIKSPSFSVKNVSIKKGSVVESLGLVIENKKEELKKTLTDTINVVKDKVLAKADSIKTEVESTIDTLKKQASTIAQEEKEDLKKKGTAILDSLKTGNIDSLPGSMEEIFNEKKDKLKELKDKVKIGFPKKKNG